MCGPRCCCWSPTTVDDIRRRRIHTNEKDHSSMGGGGLRYRLRFPRELFLRAVCGIYVAAFASISHQIRGLYGEDGLEPVDVFLYRLKKQNARLQAASPIEAIAIYPTALWLYEQLQWSPSFLMQVLALIGLTTALLGVCSARWRTTLSLAAVWFCYLSIAQGGQTFMRFQWDSFLLEVGFLAIWLAPWWHSAHAFDEPPAAVVWTLRFLFFKFMFMSGAVKIQSKCPTWLNLTALEFHFATQPLPLPLSWYAHQLPPSVLRLGVAATLLLEGPWTFFILAPSLTLRQFSAAVQVVLQLLIMLTGNYNFFNLLTVAMAATMLDVRVPVHSRPTSETHGFIQRTVARLNWWWQAGQQSSSVALASLAAAFVYCVYTFNEVFSIGFEPPSSATCDTSWETIVTSLWIRFEPTVEETQAWIGRVLPASIVACAGITAFAALWQLVSLWASCCPPQSNPQPQPRSHCRITRALYLLTSTAMAALIFCSSVLTLSTLDRPFQQSLPPFIYETYDATSHWRITSAYGLFRVMTGVGTYTRDGVQTTVVARPEIILEGTDDGGATWKPYHFQYKPGDVEVAPTLNVPFQPRLDWQMWFAALSDYQSAPWIVHLVDKLLKGSPDVKKLLDSSRDPFPRDPPQAVRAQVYYYDFTRLNTSWNNAIPTAMVVNGTSGSPWWSRTFYKEYIPVLEQGNPTLAAFVQHHFGRDPATSTATNSTCRVSASSSPLLRGWSCALLGERLVDRPVSSAVVVAASVLVVEQSVAMLLGLITQKPKQKIE